MNGKQNNQQAELQELARKLNQQEAQKNKQQLEQQFQLQKKTSTPSYAAGGNDNPPKY